MREASLILLDVGAAMYQPYQNSKKSRLEISTHCIQTWLQNKLFNHKQADAGLILFGAEESDDGGTIYLIPIKRPDLEFVRNMSQILDHQVPNLIGGDIFDALDKAVNALDQYVGNLKIQKRIFLFTSGMGHTEYNDKDILKLMKLIEKLDVKINIICLDFMQAYDADKDDPDKPDLYEVLIHNMNSFPYRSQAESTNANILFQMSQQIRSNLRIFPAQVAFELYSTFQQTPKLQRAVYRGDLQINDEFSLDILVYKRTSEEKIPSLKKFSAITQFDRDPERNKIIDDTVFYIHDDPNMTPVDKSNIIKGFQYGRHTVPVDAIMDQKMKYQCPRSFQILGFVEKKSIPRHYYMSSVDVVLPVDQMRSKKSLQAFVRAMLQTKKVAVCRYVSRQNGSPKLVALIPFKSNKSECFWMVHLPTAEDIRRFQFVSLKKSTPAQKAAMASLIDKMDLEKVPDEDGQEQEILKMKYVQNPSRQYFQQVIMHKAITLTDVVPEIDPQILSYLKPEEYVWDLAKNEIAKLKKAFNLKQNQLKKVQDKRVYWKQLFEEEQATAQTRIQQEEQIEINIEEEEMIAAFAKQKIGFSDDIVKEISTVDPINDFKKMINEKREDLVESAMNQIQKIIVRFIEESVKDSFHDKALECLKEMRKAAIQEEEIDLFNKFLNNLKDRYTMTSFWALVIREGITLITFLENTNSKVSPDVARDFLNREEQKNQILVDKLMEEEVDLFQEIE